MQAWSYEMHKVPRGQVLAAYQTSSGNVRIVRAKLLGPQQEESDGDLGANDEYDEETDAFWMKPGWYECIDHWDEWASVSMGDTEPFAWRDLPPAPAVKPPRAIRTASASL